jgi:hypothetical protein
MLVGLIKWFDTDKGFGAGKTHEKVLIVKYLRVLNKSKSNDFQYFFHVFLI